MEVKLGNLASREYDVIHTYVNYLLWFASVWKGGYLCGLWDVWKGLGQKCMWLKVYVIERVFERICDMSIRVCKRHEWCLWGML